MICSNMQVNLRRSAGMIAIQRSPRSLFATTSRFISKWGTGVINRTPQLVPVSTSFLPERPMPSLPREGYSPWYMLAFARRQSWMDPRDETWQWEKIPGKTLSECTLGIIGIGKLARQSPAARVRLAWKVLGTDVCEIRPRLRQRIRASK